MGTITIYTQYPVNELLTGLTDVPTVFATGTQINLSDLAAVQAVAEAANVGIGIGTPPFLPSLEPGTPNGEQVQIFGGLLPGSFGKALGDFVTPSGQTYRSIPAQWPLVPGAGLWNSVKLQDGVSLAIGAMTYTDNQLDPTMLSTSLYIWNRAALRMQAIPIPTTKGEFAPPGVAGVGGSTVDMMQAVTISGVNYIFAVSLFGYQGWDIATYGEPYWLWAFKETGGVWAFDSEHSYTADQLAASSSAGASAFPSATNSHSETYNKSLGPGSMWLCPNSQHLVMGNYFDAPGTDSGSIVAVNPATGVVTAFYQYPNVVDTSGNALKWSVRDMFGNPASGAGDERFAVVIDPFYVSAGAWGAAGTPYPLHPLMEFSYNGSNTITLKSPPMSPYSMPGIGYQLSYGVAGYDAAGNLWAPTHGGRGLSVFSSHEAHLFLASGADIPTFDDGGPASNWQTTQFPTFTKADFRFGSFAGIGESYSMNYDPVREIMVMLGSSGKLVGAQLDPSPALGSEMVTNGDFTAGTTGWNGFFTSTLAAVSDSDFTSGECCEMTSIAGALNFIAADLAIPVTELRNYIITFQCKGVTAAESVVIQARWSDVTGKTISSSFSPPIISPTSAIQTLELPTSSPAGAVGVSLFAKANAAGVGTQYKIGTISMKSGPATATNVVDTNKTRLTNGVSQQPTKGDIVDGRFVFALLDFGPGGYPANIGEIVSQWLVSVDLDALVLPAAPVLTVPSAPMITSVDGGNNQNTVHWVPPATNGGTPITSYTMESGAPGLETVLATGISASATSYPDTTAVNGTPVTYRVIAVNAEGNSTPSNEETGTPSASATVPSAPMILSATPGDGEVVLQIAAPASNGGSAVTSYTLKRGTATGTETSHTTGISSSATSITDSTSITNGTKEFYELVANNSVGASPPSNEVFATPQATPPSGVSVSQLTVTGGPPGARGQPAHCYCPATELNYYFGGNKGPALADTWSLDPVALLWAHITSATMPANVATSIGWDPVSSRLIAFGGDNESTWFNTTYSMDPTAGSPTWTLLTPATKPAARSGHSMFNDPVTGKLMMYGGNTGTPTYFDDLWEWSGTNWILISSSLTGTGRTGAFVETMSSGNTLIFGGFYGSGSGVLNDTYEWDGTTCTRKFPTTSPPARGFGQSAQDASGHVLIQGGANRASTVNSSDWWLWDGTNYTVQAPTGVNIGGLSSGAFDWHAASATIISAFGTQGPTGSESGDEATVYQITLGGSPPTPPSVIQGLYLGSNQLSKALSTASTLGMTLSGYSDFTDGSSWSSIGSYRPPALPVGVTLLLSPDLTPNGTGLSAITGSQKAQAQAAFTQLAETLIGIPTVLRLGCEFDGSWKPWGTGANGNTASQFNPSVTLVIGWMKAANPALKFDFCCNTGTSSLAQLNVYWGTNGSMLWDYAGGDHYDAPGGGNDFSAFGTGGNTSTGVVHLCAANNKPLSGGEIGLNAIDDPTFINDMAQVFNTPSSAEARYGWPAYTVGLWSYFDLNDPPIDSVITNKPNSLAAFQSDFA